MMSMLRRLLALMLLLLPLFLRAQQPMEALWQSYMEAWAEQYDGEELPDDLAEQLYEWLLSPINVNDTIGEPLLQLPFVTPLQQLSLKAYIAQNGQLFSVGELALVPFFDTLTRQLLAPLVVAQPIESARQLSWNKMLTQGKHSIVTGTSRTLEQAKGYHNGRYRGDPYRLYARYSYKYRDNLHFQLSADKDAGESFAWDSLQRGFDFYSFHLQLKNIGRLRNAIVGRYQLQFGQGLTLWSGCAPWGDYGGATLRYGQGIKPASAFCEYDMQQGAAATLQLSRHVELTAFYSHVNRAATLRTDTLNGDEPFVRSIYNSGYYRTDTEYNKKDLLPEEMVGANLQYRRRRFTMGLTAHHTHYRYALLPYEYPYNEGAFSGKNNFCIGMDAAWHWRRCYLFGEVARSQNGGMAQLAGLQFTANSNNRFSLLWRHYNNDYQNVYATAFGQRSDVQGENGLFFAYNATLPNRLHLSLSADFFRWPRLHYQIYSPSVGSEYKVRLQRDFGEKHHLTLQYRYKNKAENISETPLYVVGETARHYLQLLWQQQYSARWSFASRLSCSAYSEDEALETASLPNGIAYGTKGFALCHSYGLLLWQEATYHFALGNRPGQLSLRVAYFDATDYDARLYAFENDILYETSSFSYYGQGFRFAALLRCSPIDNMTLLLKYTLAYYPGQATIGTADAQLPTNHKQTLSLQCRYSF